MFFLPTTPFKYKENKTFTQTHFSKNRHSLLALLNNHLVDYPTPITLTYTWGFGSLAGIFLGLQIITGLLLAMHYAPNVAIAFDILEHIMRDVNNGWLWRYLHANGASFFFVIVYLHIGRGLYYFSYLRNPFVWISGMLLFALMMAIAFMGYVLPWGQMSFWGATVITNLFSAIPVIGQDIAFWLWGGFSVDNPTLNRFFALHFLLPFVLLGLVGLHLIFLHRPGSTNPLSLFDTSCDKIPFFPYFYWKDLTGLLFFCTIYAYFVFFLPDLLGHPDNYIEGNPMVTPTHIVPEWYFLPFYAILRSIPDKLGGVVLMAASILMLFVLALANTIFGRYNKRGITVSFFTLRDNLSYHIAIWFFFFTVIVLAWIGSQPVTPTIVLLGQLNTLIYFVWLVYFPLVSLSNPEDSMEILIFLSLLKKILLITAGVLYWTKIYTKINSQPILAFFVINSFLTHLALGSTFYYLCFILFLMTIYFIVYNAPKHILKIYLFELFFFAALSMVPLCYLIILPSNWIHFYLLFEISALSTTILIASRRYNPYAVSAGIMYYFVSIVASVFLLLGIFFLYFEYGTFDIQHSLPTLKVTAEMYQISELALKTIDDKIQLGTWGAILILFSFAVKIGIAPFHGWAISVNAGAPLHITAYLQTIYKGLLITIFIILLWNFKTTTFFNYQTIDNLIGITGFITLFICSLGTLVQAGFKQFWAYLSTATVGFLFILLALNQYILSIMYMVIYFFCAILFFAIVLILTKATETNKIQFLYLTDFKYTQQINLYFVIFCIVLLLTFAGLPPTAAFYVKFMSYFFILQDYGILVLFSITILHLISAFLYLKILKIMLFDNHPINTPIENKIIFNGTVIDIIFVNGFFGLFLLYSIQWEYIYSLSINIFQY